MALFLLLRRLQQRPASSHALRASTGSFAASCRLYSLARCLGDSPPSSLLCRYWRAMQWPEVRLVLTHAPVYSADLS